MFFYVRKVDPLPGEGECMTKEALDVHSEVSRLIIDINHQPFILSRKRERIQRVPCRNRAVPGLLV